MKAMILAAGRGQRLRPLTDRTPKPLVEVGGRPLIQHHLEGLRDAGIAEFVVNLGWLGEQVREVVGDGSRFGVNIAYSEEGWPALEVGGGIHNALPLLGAGAFIVANADVFAPYPWPALVERARSLPAGVMAHLVLVPNPVHHPQGDFTLEENRVGNPGGSVRAHTFSGLSIHRPEFFAGCKPGHFPMLPLWREGAARGQITGELYEGPWSDVGTPERLESLRASLC